VRELRVGVVWRECWAAWEWWLAGGGGLVGGLRGFWGRGRWCRVGLGVVFLAFSVGVVVVEG